LGVKACVPFWPMIAIVAELEAIGVGVVVGELLLQPDAAVSPANNAEIVHTRNDIIQSFRELYGAMMLHRCKASTSRNWLHF